MNALTVTTHDRDARARSFFKSFLAVLGVAVLLADPALASGGAAMPWDSAMTTLGTALTGTTVRLVAVIAIAIGGFVWAFTKNEEGAKRIGQVVLGCGVALGAPSFVTTLGISGASF